MSWLSNRVLLLKNRYVPILMLWVVLGGVAQSVSFIWARVYTGTESTGINIEAFGDGRVPVILAIGLGLLLVLFAVLERVGLTGTADRERVQKFFDTLWDEIVSALCHFSAGLFVLWGFESFKGYAAPRNAAIFLLVATLIATKEVKSPGDEPAMEHKRE
jgi:hypothetical protein